MPRPCGDSARDLPRDRHPWLPALLGLLALMPLACSGEGAPGEESSGLPAFRRAGAELGFSFTHVNGMSGERYFCEMVGPGGALFDADGDGDLDLFITQGSSLGGVSLAETTFPPPAEAPAGDRLFLNLLSETGELRFEDRSRAAGFATEDYGMGCTVGDVDGDGDLDLFVTNFGPDRLYLNRGDGTFEDGTGASGLGDARWTTSAAFIDVEGDGDLDLYVCSYVDYTLENHKPCYSETSAIDYCGPSSYRPLPDRLYLNRGDGTFEDGSEASRIGSEVGAGLGLATADFDGDGLVDIYVANDGTPNHLWRNRGDGTFENTGLLAGCAYNRDGRAEASMGVEVADFDADGDPDIFLTHLTDETNTLYSNDGRGTFEDLSARSGLGVPSRAYTGFGTATLDFDQDGDLDLFIANGAVKTVEELAARGDPYPLHQPDQLFRNDGGGAFEEVSAEEAPFLLPPAVGRGLIAGDVDGDGACDLVVLNNSQPARLLLGRPPAPDSWVGFDVRGTAGGAPLLGAKVRLSFSSGGTLERRVRVAASYLCANDPRLLFGLANAGPGPITGELILSDGRRIPLGTIERGRYHAILPPPASRSPR